jgi:hypothetical protein
MSRAGLPCRSRMRPPRYRAKNFSTCTRSSDCARFSHTSQYAMGDVAFSASERDRHLGIDRFAAQYLARGLPCERFTAALASRTSCITRGWDGWLDLSHGGLSPPILCQLAWRTPQWVNGGHSDYVGGTSGVPEMADDLSRRLSRQPWALCHE